MSRSLGRSALAALAALIALPAPAAATAQAPPAVPGEVVVGFTERSSAATRAAARDAVDARLDRRLTDTDVQVLEVDGSVRRAVSVLRARRGVAFAEPNYIGRVAAEPDDFDALAQWNLVQISMPPAWDRAQGSGAVRVAVVDTGVDAGNPDLAGRLDLDAGYDAVDGDGNPADGHGHGTHVAGILAAVPGNGIGVSGVAWDVTVVPMRACDDEGVCTTADQADAIQRAGQAGVRLANVSVEGPATGSPCGGSCAVSTAIADHPDMLVVAAAGNSARDLDSGAAAASYPCSFPHANVVCVASTTQWNTLATSSNHGRSSVDLAAPGNAILSVNGTRSGTSMAAPHVAGTAALMWASAPSTGLGEVKEALLATADPMDALAGKVASGGRVNAAAAIAAVDDEGPLTTVTHRPAARTTAATVSFGSVASEAPASFQCRVDSGAWELCGATHEVTVAEDGLHVFEVRAIDGSGNAGPASDPQPWWLDRVAPAIDVISAEVDGRTATVTFTADEEATYSCRAGGAAFTPCASPAAFERLPNGERTIEIRATDGAGNSATEAVGVRVDAPPLAVVASGPAAYSPSAAALFDFAASDPPVASGFECRLDEAAGWAACPDRYDGLAEGEHTLAVRALDDAGAPGEPTTFSWTVDTIAPVVRVDGGPQGLVASRSAVLPFTVQDDTGSPLASAECRLGSADFAPCPASPWALNDLADGPHTAAIRVRDAAGNEGTAARAWQVDATAPAVTFLSAPATSVDGTASFAFASEDGATLECSLDGAAFSACASPLTLTGLADGVHRLAVRATDTLGNVGTPVAREFTVQRPGTPVPDANPAPVPGATVDPEVEDPGTTVPVEPPDELAQLVADRFRGRTPARAARVRSVRVIHTSVVPGRLRVRAVLLSRRPFTVLAGRIDHAEAGTERLVARAPRKAARRLARRRSGRVRITVTFRAQDGRVARSRQTVRLRRAPRP